MIRVVTWLVLLATSAAAWDSRCYVSGVDCKPGPEAARNRWIGPSDEHRVLLEATRVLAGLPADVSDSFTLTTFTGDSPVDVAGQSMTSIAPVDFANATRVTERDATVGEFAQLPDFSFALWDWITGNETCPLGASIPAQDCHDFTTHMGPVNSNHFPPQTQHFYGYYHQLALDRAAACHTMETRLGAESGRFADFLRACEDEALVLEATGQHFLQDGWSSGHMWERWGSPDLTDFPSMTTALLVAMTSGLIHGARAVLEEIPISHPDIAAALAAGGIDLTQYEWNDPMCAPHPDVGWIGPLAATPRPAFGDLFLADATDFLTAAGGAFPEQYRGLFSCAASGLLEVYLAAGEQHGAATPPDASLVSLDPRSNDCFGQRATNRAMARGIGLDFVDPNGTAQRLELDGVVATQVVPVLSTQAGGQLTPALLQEYAIDIADVVFTAQVVAQTAPDRVDIASGLLGPFLGVDVNHVFVKTPLAAYADPPLPWPAGGERADALGRAFHRAHAIDWCNRFRSGAPDDVEALRARIVTLRETAAPASEVAAACAVCREFATRSLRVGTGEADYDTTREPLCHFVADDPANAQYVYRSGSASDEIPALAGAYCDCACPSMFIGSMVNDTDQTDFTNEVGNTRHGFEHDRFENIVLTRLPDGTFEASGTFAHDLLDASSFPGDPGETCHTSRTATGTGTVTAYDGTAASPAGSLEATATVTETFEFSPCRGQPGSTDTSTFQRTFRSPQSTPTIEGGCLVGFTWDFFFFDPDSNTTDSQSGQLTAVP